MAAEKKDDIVFAARGGDLSTVDALISSGKDVVCDMQTFTFLKCLWDLCSAF